MAVTRTNFGRLYVQEASSRQFLFVETDEPTAMTTHGRRKWRLVVEGFCLDDLVGEKAVVYEKGRGICRFRLDVEGN